MNIVPSNYANSSIPAEYSRSASAILSQGDGLEKAGNTKAWEKCLLLVDNRALERECLAKALADHGLGMEVAALGSIDEWRREKDAHLPIGAILYCIGGRKANDVGLANEISRVTSEFKSIATVVLADTDDLTLILKMIECGARGFIPTSVGVEVCAEAIALAIAGGIFVPATSVLAMRHLLETGRQEEEPMSGMFTMRQAEVVQALRKGKANKIIAYELNLCESTVKVHIRNIMKKLKATNRTEVAYKLNDLFPGDAT